MLKFNKIFTLFIIFFIGISALSALPKADNKPNAGVEEKDQVLKIKNNTGISNTNTEDGVVLEYYMTDEMLDNLNNSFKEAGFKFKISNNTLSIEILEKEKVFNYLIELEQEARTCETELTQLRKKLLDHEQKILNATDPLKKENLKKEFEEMKKDLKAKSDEMFSIMKQKAEVYKALEKTGDPVDVSTGKFIANLVDYKSQDYLDKFSVGRYLICGNHKESFGNNWVSSLDERIIRCNYKNVEDKIASCREILEDIKNIKQTYNIDSWTVSNSNTKLGEIYNTINDCEVECNKILNNLIEIDKIYKELNEKNKYVLYGEFSDLEDFPKSNGLLIYVTDKGQKLPFLYDFNGVWTGCKELESIGIKINNLNSNGEYSYNTNCDGGYEIAFEDGSKRIFSEYGILEKVIDRNNNETIYKSKNGKIYEIILKTGEILNIDRNEKNYITSIHGDVSGSANYIYSGDNLVKVINNENIVIGYEYNENNELISINKNNNSKIKIEYEYNSELKENVCAAVTNSNNDKEEFDFDPLNRIMKHNYYGYGNEIYKFNDEGKTVYYSDLQGNVMECEYDTYGNILSIIKNGIKKNFVYDDKYNNVSTIYEDGSTDRYFYNEMGLITKVIDRDGNSNSYEYDDNGNIIRGWYGNTECGNYWYYPNGLLKGYSEGNKTVEFKYNKFGSVIEKTEKIAGEKAHISTWKYDDKNRLIEAIEYNGDRKQISYDGNKEIIISGNRKVTNIYNNRKFIIKQIDEDLKTGEKHVKENVYDSLDNIVKVFVDDALLSEYEYFKNGVLKSFTVWNNPNDENKQELLYGIKTDFLYNSNWRKSEEVVSKIKENKIVERISAKKYSYTKQNKLFTVYEKKYLGSGKSKTFNEDGKLIKEEWDNGYCINYSYSKAGKVLTKKDNKDNFYQYKYLPDGSYKVLYQNCYGGKINYTYNNLGQIINIKDYYGFSRLFGYNSSGNLISIKDSDSIIKYSYDYKDRMVKCTSFENGKCISEYSVEYDDENNVKTIYSDGYIESIEKYNVWGMIKELKSGNGHYYFDYDYLGNCKKITDFYGNETVYEYSPDFNVLLQKEPNGKIKKYDYNLIGVIRNISNNGRTELSCIIDDNFIETSQLGSKNRIDLKNDNYDSEMSFYDTGKYYKEKTINGYSKKDEAGNVYKYETDKSNKIIKEINPLGDSIEFSYGVDGTLIQKINPSGVVENCSYNAKERTGKIEYSTGEVVEFVCNALGNITKVNTNDYSLEYEYDKSGNLISEYSAKTDTRINYNYDSFSRCIKKSGTNFSFSYSYDEMGLLTKMEDEKTGAWVSLKYDNLFRIINKKYSNGIETNFGYNDFGQKEYYVSKNRIGAIISGDFFLYDDFGRIRIKANSRGSITQYKYDDNGRLISSEYTYSTEMRDAYLEEATECGFFIKEKNPKTTKLNLATSDLVKLQQLYELGGINGFTFVNSSQDVWCERYNYNENGNIKSIENPYGEIEYCYDALNRIISKNYKSTNENGISLKWNKDNCLEEVVNKQNRLRFSYNALKRPIKVEKEDFINGNHEIIEYKYDGFGRRVIEKYNNVTIENIYDGFSTVLLSKQCITNNNFISSLYSYDEDENKNEGIYRNSIKNYNESSTYRMVDNNKYKPYGEVKQYGDENKNINKYSDTKKDYSEDNRISYSVLSLGMTPVLYSYIDGSHKNNSESEFIISDYKNKITGSFDKNSDCINYYEYDTWGNCISGKDEFMDNLGYRDYVPSLKIFTTEDPIRDGMNWFAYCPCDPVNYNDIDGFLKQSYSLGENFEFQAFIMDFIIFIETEYHDQSLRDENNCYMGIYGAYDCVDTLMAACVNAMKKAGLQENLEKMIEFAELYFSGEMQESKNVACSADIYSGKMGRKVCGGMDSEYFKNKPDLSEKDLTKLDKIKSAEKQEAIKNLRDPNIIQPGAVLVWKNSKYNGDDCPNSCGHGAIVVSREFDESGNVVGFFVLQGHTGGVEYGQTLGEKTELTYINVSTDDTDIYDFYGEFDGVYEMEDPNAPKKDWKCVI